VCTEDGRDVTLFLTTWPIEGSTSADQEGREAVDSNGVNRRRRGAESDQRVGEEGRRARALFSTL